MYVGRDFDVADTSENEPFALDFIAELVPGDTINSAVWSCSVAETSDNPDDAASTRLVGSATVTGTITAQRVRGLLPGVKYVLKATVATASGDSKTLWSHVTCEMIG